MPGSSVFSLGLPGAVDCRQDQPPCAAFGVLGHLRELGHIPELVWLAQLALADRAGIRVRERHDPVCDRLARDALS